MRTPRRRISHRDTETQRGAPEEIRRAPQRGAFSRSRTQTRTPDQNPAAFAFGSDPAEPPGLPGRPARRIARAPRDGFVCVRVAQISARFAGSAIAFLLRVSVSLW